jgi:hypothetical protein
MKKSMKFLAMVSTAVMAAVGLQASPANAAAYPVTHFYVDSGRGGGSASGSIIWYNRSVEIQGSVVDKTSAGGHSTATFSFIAPGLTPETRTDLFDYPYTSTSFHFTETYDHPGGISLISLEVCTTDPLHSLGGCHSDLPYSRSTP